MECVVDRRLMSARLKEWVDRIKRGVETVDWMHEPIEGRTVSTQKVDDMACRVMFARGIPRAESAYEGLTLYVFSGFCVMESGPMPLELHLQSNDALQTIRLIE